MLVQSRIRRTGPEVLSLIRRQVQDPTRAYEAIVNAWRLLIREEFDRGQWRATSGPPRPWARKVPFGSLQSAGASHLRKSGALARAWQGGKGGYTDIRRDGASFGVDLRLVPYAAVHRGGLGKITAKDSRRPHRQKVTPKMRAFLHAHGVHLKNGTAFLTTPRRPHATLNPEIRTRATAIFAAHVTGRPLRVAA